MTKIPNTNLTLTEAEIQAVIEYYLQRDTGGSHTAKEEFEIPEKYRSMVNTGKLKRLYGEDLPIPKYITREEGKHIND